MFRSVKFPAVTAGIVLGGFLLLLLPSQARAQGKPWVRIDDASRFQVLQSFNNEAVLDRETGLIWQQSVAAAQMTYPAARSQCLLEATGGRRGWRLPVLSELSSLIDPTVLSSPRLPAGHPFSNVTNGFIWSDTPVGPRADDQNFLRLQPGFGNIDFGGGAQTGFVWCVRGGGETY